VRNNDSLSLPAVPTDVILEPNMVQLLTSYERTEIMAYSKVYYLGSQKSKDIRRSITQRTSSQRSASHYRSFRQGSFVGKSTSNGFDSSNGFYKVIEGDHLAYRYETMKELGRGTFGQVIKCLDHKTGSYVAVKLTKSFSDSGLENCLREVRILETSQQVQSTYANRIVHLEDYFKFRNHLCIVFELLSFDIYRDIKNKSLEGFKTME
jgi:Protein kinase domain